MMIRWWEHSQKGVTDRRTDGQTDRRKIPFVELLGLDLDLVSNRQTSSVEYHADGGSAARYGESFASRCLKLSADGQLTASAGRRFQSGIVRG